MQKVSIIIPVYNVMEYIDECMESIVMQDYENLEIILINDGSTDASLHKCNEWKCKDNRIIVINNKNHGVSYSRNIALKKCTGKYISFIDPDDVVSVNFISSMVKLIEENNVDIACCNIKRFYLKSEIVNIKDVEGIYITSDIKKEIFLNVGGFLANKLYKSSIIKKNKIFLNESIHISEDLLFNLEYISYCKYMVVEKSYKYFYRQHMKSAYQSFNSKWFSVIDAYSLLLSDNKLVSGELRNIVQYNYLMILCESKYRFKHMENKDKNIEKRINSEWEKYFKRCIINKFSNIQKLKIYTFTMFPDLVFFYKQRKMKGINK